MTYATPRPWKLETGPDGQITIWGPDDNPWLICSIDSRSAFNVSAKDNGRFIVLAANSHDDLLKCLKDLMANGKKATEEEVRDGECSDETYREWEKIHERCKTAVARAEGKGEQ